MGENSAYTTTGWVTNLPPGEHKLTMYYLERGASMSNFKLRFNLTTRYSMTLRKENTLEANLLNGAKFAVYTDESCADAYAAKLWPSREAYERDKDGTNYTNVFEVKNGKAEMWGLAAGNTYYLKEILGPKEMNYVPAQGVIRVRLKNDGLPDYEVMPDQDNNLTVGYTAYGYKVNEELQEAYLRITNTDAIESEPTEVTVKKVWNDTKDHSGDEVTVYLVANGIRIQEVILSEANDWKHTWVNLPSTDRNKTPVIYTVHESTFPGYVSSVTDAKDDDSGSGGGTGGTLSNASGFKTNETYLLYTKYGYLGASGNNLRVEADPSIAQGDRRHLWTAAVNSDGTVTLTNQEGQTLYWADYAFRASGSPSNHKNLIYENGTLSAMIHFDWGSREQFFRDYPEIGYNLLYDPVIRSTETESEALAITPQIIIPDTPTMPDSGEEDEPIRDFLITNTPVKDATVSLRVYKMWNLGSLGTDYDYEESTVVMDLLADGKDAGLSGTLNLRNGWSYTFTNLPKFDSNGKEIAYSVREETTQDVWRVEYGPITPVGGSNTAYETTVTNVYRMTVMLPETGSFNRQVYIIAGLSIMIGGLSWYSRERRREERRDRT